MFLSEGRLVVSAVIMKAQNRRIDCWDQADLLPMTGAMLGGMAMKHCVLAGTYVLCLLPNKSSWENNIV